MDEPHLLVPDNVWKATCAQSGEEIYEGDEVFSVEDEYVLAEYFHEYAVAKLDAKHIDNV